MFAYCDNIPTGTADSEGGRPYNVNMTDSGPLDGQNRARIRYLEAKKAEKERLVIDFSWALPVCTAVSAKAGVSLVIDLINEDVEVYHHGGVALSNASGPTFSIGAIENYEQIGDYKGLFFDMNAGCIAGIDNCHTLEADYEDRVKATSFVLSIPTPFNIVNIIVPSAGVGFDYYLPPIVIDLYPQK